MRKRAPTRAELSRQNEKLLERAREAEETLRAIREGEVDAIVVSGGSRGEQIFSLSTAESVYRLIAETMQEAAVTVASPEGTILFCNDQFASLLSTSPEIPVGKHFTSFVERSDWDTARRILSQAETGPVKERLFLRGLHSPVPVLISASPLKEPGGRSICLVLSDLSELENSTTLIERLRIQQGITEAVLARLRIVGETAATLLKARDPLLALNGVCHQVARLLDCDVFANYLVAVDGRTLELRNSFGIPREMLRRFESVSLEESVCGKVIQTGKAQILSVVQSHREPCLDLTRSLGVEAYACLPLVAGGKVRGTLSFGSRKRFEFTADEISLVQTIADQAATALNRHFFEQALERANADLELTVAARTAELAETVNKLKSSNAALEMQMGRLRSMALELSTAEQRERRRLATLLHDDLQQILVGARYHMDSVATGCEGPRLSQVKAVVELLERSLAITRSLTSELSPAILHLGSFSGTLRRLAGWARTRHGLEVDLVAPEEIGELPEQVALLLAETVRELLFNVVKHAGTGSATVTCTRDPGSLCLTVADRGKGFDPSILSPTARSESYGLFSIGERMSALGGRLDIESEPGKGSRFTLTIPREKLSRPAAAPD